MTEHHLVDHLAAARITAPSPSYVEIQSAPVGRSIRTAIFHHPPSIVRFRPLKAAGEVTIRTACGIKSVARDRIRGPVRFRLGIRAPDNEEKTLAEMVLDPVAQSEHREWVPLEVTVSLEERWNVPEIRIVLETRMEDPSIPADHAWTCWADPVVVSSFVSKPPRTYRRPRPLVLLLTSDALRQDHLGCFQNGGNPEKDSPTPELDRLAEEAFAFPDCRANSTTTPGSYATLLTGLSPLSHGIHTEWGAFPAAFPSLPLTLASLGFRTVFAPSERELTSPEQAFSRIFHETLPCLANPAQEGALTVRKFVRWLDHQDLRETPVFGWMQFFDTHPPECPPESLRRKTYPHDPASPEREHLPEQLSEVRGIESVLDIANSTFLLDAGLVPKSLLERLRTTADCLRGRTMDRPDLASHLFNLGSPATQGLPANEFGFRMEGWVKTLERGRIPLGFREWLAEIDPQLRELESDILAWLDDVRDFRYIDALYEASVMNLDRIFGLLRQELEERGLWENTTLLFTSPHGEILSEASPPMHHHNPMESVLRVPLLFKPGTLFGRLRPRRMTGSIDLQDLYPTLLGLLGLELPPSDGADLSDFFLRGGGGLPSRPSFATDFTLSSASLHLAGRKLTRFFEPHCSRPRSLGPFPYAEFESTAPARDAAIPSDEELKARFRFEMESARPLHGFRKGRSLRRRRLRRILERK